VAALVAFMVAKIMVAVGSTKVSEIFMVGQTMVACMAIAN
jgi:hypothetical protein